MLRGRARIFRFWAASYSDEIPANTPLGPSYYPFSAGRRLGRGRDCPRNTLQLSLDG